MGQGLGSSVPFNKASFLRTCFSTASECPMGTVVPSVTYNRISFQLMTLPVLTKAEHHIS